MREVFKFIMRFLARILYRVKVVGRENVPKEGAAIICPNHVQALDGPVVISFVKRKINVFARDDLFATGIKKWFAKVCLIQPIKRDTADINAIKLSLKLLKSNEVIMIFPEGTRNGMAKGIKPKNGAVTIACKTGVPIIPVGINGTFKPFRKVIIKIGKPITYEDNSKDKEIINNLTQELMDQIIALRDL